MPLGSSKISVNKNRLNAGSGSGLVNVSITDSISNTSVSPIDYRTVTYDITSNRPNSTFYYEMEGNILSQDFADGITGNVTTDSNGNAQVIKTITDNVVFGDDLDFKLNIRRSNVPNSTLFADSNVNIIYAAQYPNISGANSTFVNTSNVYLDGKFHEITSDTTITVNDKGSIASNAFLTVIGYYDTDSYYYSNAFRVLAVGGGGAGGISSSTADGGGAGGNVTLSTVTLADIQDTTYTLTVGAGGTGTFNADGGAGGNTSVFAGSTIEIISEGGGGGQANTNDADGGNVAGFVGGDGKYQSGSTQRWAAGGGASPSGNGSDGLIADTPVGGNGADGTVISLTNRPEYAGTTLGGGVYGGGGGGSARKMVGGTSAPVQHGFGGTGGGANGGGGTGVDGLGGGGGGGSGTIGGSGYIAIRYPAGTDFRFISSVDLS